MFKSLPAAVPPVVVSSDDLIPISHLSLDLDASPAGGWDAYLDGRGIPVVFDDIGRMAVARDDARQLLTEKREREAEQARRRKLAEAQAVADDQIRRAAIWQGVPADLIPPGVSAASVMLQASKEAQPKRQSVLQHALGNSGNWFSIPSVTRRMHHEPSPN
jgi:hypothetical protein